MTNEFNIQAFNIEQSGFSDTCAVDEYDNFANEFKIIDMLGNVMEWTLDEYRSDYAQTTTDTDPSVSPTDRHPRTLKGGCFSDKPTDLRPANRIKSDPIWNRRDPQIPKSKWWNADAPFIGFRIVRPVTQLTKEEIEAFFKLYLE